MEKRPSRGQTWYTEEEEIRVYGKSLADNYFGDRRTNLIWFRKQVDKKEIKFSCKTKSPDAAYRFAPKRMKEKLAKPDEKPKTLSLVSEEIDKFQSKKESEVEPGTFDVIKRSLGRFKEFYGNELAEIFDDSEWEDLITVSPAELEIKTPEERARIKLRWKAFLDWHQKTYPGQGLFNIIKYARAFVSHLHQKGVIKRRPKIPNPFAKKEARATKKRKQRVLSKTEIKQILKAARRRSLSDAIIVMLGYLLAFRMSDALTLTWDRVHLDPEDPYIQFSGDDKEETFVKVPLPKALFKRLVLLRQAPESKESDWVFPQVFKKHQHLKPQQFDFRKILSDAGVKYESFHILRHTRLTLDFGNPKIPQAHILLFRRVSLQVALEHYIHLTADDRKSLLANMTGVE